MSKLDLLAFNVKNSFEGEKFEKALNWLPKNEHASILRYKFDKDRHLALANRLLRRHYFSNELNISWFDLEFDRLPAGKPILKNAKSKNYDFNTSHEGDWVIFGCTKDMKIGVDAVVIDKPKSGSIDSFIKSFSPQFTQNEMQLIINHDNEDSRLETFYQFWGCKESYTKAVGLGLSLDLSKLEFLNEEKKIDISFEGNKLNSWLFHISYLDPVTLAVICCGYDESHRKLDDDIETLAQSTLLLGQCLRNINQTKDIFTPITFEDIENNKWILRT
ncbi:4'-phosphopantetheinyl transferase superfamily [Cokeromyces recurvatus]|uniref:4'-phosphopantetheinyl transferase superfamily n=1 Tax=Cokeromyces recurvatus TaxID=90255 RepID=UPI00221F7B4A|nr:4'-phosphopantetheinyl transferase superfamily [Cokeromyces recurvatus]KAI7901607.1 4'-phosphopantetheinyl transferase superfamily [Cokeromyces recurvatus]